MRWGWRDECDACVRVMGSREHAIQVNRIPPPLENTNATRLPLLAHARDQRPRFRFSTGRKVFHDFFNFHRNLPRMGPSSGSWLTQNRLDLA